MLHDPVYLWLFAGALLITVEALTAPGIGLFLGGLGAITTALVLQAEIINIDATAAQFAWCFGATAVWTAILWKPLRKFRMRSQSQVTHGTIGNSNLIGGTATVAAGGLAPEETGQVMWSGTLMRAELENDVHAPLAEGSKVIIRSVAGNLLKVSPKL